LIAGDDVTAIMGTWISCSTKNIQSVSTFEQIDRFTNKKEGGLTAAHLIFLVTMATTCSWAGAVRRKVANMARERENWYELIVDA
jgi:hypothetical protein